MHTKNIYIDNHSPDSAPMGGPEIRFLRPAYRTDFGEWYFLEIPLLYTKQAQIISMFPNTVQFYELAFLLQLHFNWGSDAFVLNYISVPSIAHIFYPCLGIKFPRRRTEYHFYHFSIQGTKLIVRLTAPFFYIWQNLSKWTAAYSAFL